MKLAILGSSPIALEAALRFHLHGAALTFFHHERGPWEELFQSPELDPRTFVSDLGLALLKEAGADIEFSQFSWQHWKKNYYQPLVKYLAISQTVRSQEVVSITKRYLAPGERPSGKSRFYDLFRVIYLVNPREFIEQQKERDPEIYRKLSDEFVGSLQSSIEMFEDFDLVLDLRSSQEASSMAVTGRALGESRVSREKVLYGPSALQDIGSLLMSEEVREMALVGSGPLAAEVLLKIQEWLKDARNRLFLITTEDEPFADFLKHAQSHTRKKLESMLRQVEERAQEDLNRFHQVLREWQELDDFIRAKKPRPAEPVPQLNFFSGHNVTAIDELIDRRRLFLTLEKPDFRMGKKHPENNRVELKTIGVDRILVANELSKKDITPFLEIDEPGFFQVENLLPNEEGAWKSELEQLQGIEDEIFKMFSPADHH